MAVALAAACSAPRGDTTVVSGKTVYRGMAVEEVRLEAFAESPQEAGPTATGRSGYHGSFALRLPPGSYRLTARGTLPGPAGTDLPLAASTVIEVHPGAARIDRVVVELRASEEP